ncbi:MAG: sugar phosphate isomerase/epimerase family protein [Pirellulales bacterium]
MTTHCTRRTFLAQGAGALCATAGLAPLLSRAAAAETKAAPWPATCRDAMLRSFGKPDCWAALRAIGAEGVEAVVGEDLSLAGLFHPTIKYTAADDAGIARLAADAQAAGQRITALCMANRFAERPEAEIAWCGRVAKAARALGASAIRIDVVPGRLARPEFLKLAVATLRKVMAETEATGVRFAIENHGNTTNDPEFLQPLFDGVGSNRLGLTLDTGNFYWFGHPLAKVYQLYETFAPRAFHTHCKSIRYPQAEREKQRPMGWKYGEYECPIDAGDLDFRRIIAILRKAGYAGDLCVENEALGNLAPDKAVETVAREIALLKRLRSET